MWTLYLVLIINSSVAAGSTEFNTESECIAAMVKARELIEGDLRVSCWHDQLGKSIDKLKAIDIIQ